MKIKKKEAAAIKLALPKTKTEPCEKLFDYVTLLFGLKKIGKTSLCAALGEAEGMKPAFFMPFESGTKALSVYQPMDEDGNPRTLTDWGDFRAFVRLICKDTKFGFVVIDPIDKAHKACTTWKCKEMGIEHPSEGDWGKGWEGVKDEFASQIDKLISSGKGVIFISHAIDKKIKTRTGDEYDLITSTLPNQARECIEGIVDIWAYYCYKGKERYLTILGDDHIGAGHRVKGRFRYTDGKRVRNIPMGSNEEEAANNLLMAFNNELVNPKSGKKKIKRRIK